MVDTDAGGGVKRWRIAGTWLLGVVLAPWFALLIVLGTSIVLLFAGLIVPNVTVQTIIEGWGWTAMVLTLVVVGWAASRRKLGHLLHRSALRGYAWSTLFVVSLIVLFYVVERWRGHHAWKKLEGELQGELLELSRLEPLPVPEEQNFAALPLVEQWWRESSPKVDGIRLHRLVDRVSGKAAGAWELQQPVDLVVCLQHYLRLTPTPEPREGIVAGQFLAAWKEFDLEMEQISAGSERPYGRFDLPYDRGMFDDTLPNKTALFRALGLAFRLRAVSALADGASGRALADVERLCRVSELVGQEPLLERQRLTLLLAAVQPVWEGITRSQWSEAQLATLQAVLARPDLLREHREAVRKEFLLLIDLCEKIISVRSRVPPTDLTEEFPARMLISGLRLLYPTGWALQNQVGLHQLGREIRERTVASEDHRVFVDATRQIERNWVHRPPSLDPFFATFIMPRGRATAEDATQRYAYVQCALDLAATACALERYRLARRRLPESLDLLVPDWLDRIPTDVIDGRPLRYRRLDPARYILYSVGWNQTDDGGKVGQRPGPLEAWEDSLLIKDEGDWVWKAESKD